MCQVVLGVGNVRNAHGIQTSGRTARDSSPWARYVPGHAWGGKRRQCPRYSDVWENSSEQKTLKLLNRATFTEGVYTLSLPLVWVWRRGVPVELHGCVHVEHQQHRRVRLSRCQRFYLSKGPQDRTYICTSLLPECTCLNSYTCPR